MTDGEKAALDPVTDTPERAALRKGVCQLIADVSPEHRVQSLDESETFDDDLFRALAEMGILEIGLTTACENRRTLIENHDSPTIPASRWVVNPTSPTCVCAAAPHAQAVTPRTLPLIAALRCRIVRLRLTTAIVRICYAFLTVRGFDCDDRAHE